MTVFNPNSGVNGHSSPDAWQEFIIFSVDGAEFDTPNHELTATEFEEYCKKHDIPVTRLIGSYEGRPEYSWVLPKDVFFGSNQMAALWCKNQDSVLHLSKPEKRSRMWRDATLLYSNPANIEPIGKFKQVTKKEALTNIAWTCNPNNGAYWITE